MYSMTVELKNGQRYDAKNIQIVRKGWGGDYMTEVVVFVCSGVITSFDCNEVKDITYNFADVTLPTSVGLAG